MSGSVNQQKSFRQKAKHSAGRFRKPVGKKPSRSKPATPAGDLAARKKIGATLDVAAFLSHHQQNSQSIKHWETKE